MSVRLEAAVEVEVEQRQGWLPVGSGVTDSDGRLKSWGERPIEPGSYRLTFDTGNWFAERERECFYPEVTITFVIRGSGHHHVPLLLAQYAYSTYRGS
jgi:5-hydroxyisourate hydrolase